MPTRPIILAIVVVGIAGLWLLGSSLRPGANRNVNYQPTNTSSQVAPMPSLELTEYGFTPAEFEAGASQTITVKLTNRGQEIHTFAFTSLDFRSGEIAPGETITVRFTTPSTPGRYDFVCNQPGHADRGMRGTMVVK